MGLKTTIPLLVNGFGLLQVIAADGVPAWEALVVSFQISQPMSFQNSRFGFAGGFPTLEKLARHLAPILCCLKTPGNQQGMRTSQLAGVVVVLCLVLFLCGGGGGLQKNKGAWKLEIIADRPPDQLNWFGSSI